MSVLLIQCSSLVPSPGMPTAQAAAWVAPSRTAGLACSVPRSQSCPSPGASSPSENAHADASEARMQGAVWVGDPDLPHKRPGSSRGAIIELGARNGHRGQWARTSNLLLRSLILPRKELLFCVTVRLRTWCVPSLHSPRVQFALSHFTSVTESWLLQRVHVTSLRRQPLVAAP